MSLTSARLKALNAVVDEGSYSAAGRRLGMTQPAISQAVQKLEEAFSVTLFEKRGRYLVPTDLCLELAEITARMAELEEAAQDLLTRGGNLERGTLRIGLGNAMPGMALIGAFQSKVPRIHAQVQLGNYQEIIRAVLDRQVDVGILPEVPDDRRFVRRACLRQDLVAIIHPDHVLSGRKRVSLAELATHRLIFRSEGSSTQRVVDRAFQRLGMTVTAELVLETKEAVCEAVASNLGIGFMWSHGTSRQDGIRRLPVLELDDRYEEIVFRRADTRNPIVDTFFHALESIRL